MSKVKDYTGMSVVCHTITQGEYLSLISKNYELPNWQAIWLFNTKIRKVYLGDDPDVVQPGQRLFIPRTPKGYDAWLAKIATLKREMELFADTEIFKQESSKADYQSMEVMFNFVGDVATTLATLGLQAANSAKAAKVANETVGKGRIAAQYLADVEAKKLSDCLVKTLKDKSRGAVANKLDQAVANNKGKPSSSFSTANDIYGSSAKGVKAIANFSLKGGKFLLDVTDIVLDYAKPATIANAWLFLTTGETVSMTFANQTKQIRATSQKAILNLDKKLVKIAEERNIIYPPGGSTIGSYYIPPHTT